VELVCKLIVHRLHFFSNEENGWNMFDFFLVVFAVYDQLMVALSSDAGGTNLTWMRSLRILKIAKILRVFRLMRLLSELRLMLNSLMGSAISLFWSIMMMLLIFYMFGLVFVQGTASHLLEVEAGDAELSAGNRSDLLKHFGSVQEAMLTLFMASSGGQDWSVYYDYLKVTGWVNSALFLFFNAFTQIALLNILTGIFVENAMKFAAPDRDTLALEHRKQELVQATELRRICHEIDKSGNGKLSTEEFEEHIAQGKLHAYLATLGLDIKDSKLFFDMLREASLRDGEVDIESFVNGCMRLKGGATSLDMQALLFETKVIHRNQVLDFEKLEALLANMSESFSRSSAPRQATCEPREI